MLSESAGCHVVTDQRQRELKRHGTSLFPISCYHADLEAEGIPWHWHYEFEAAFVERGTVLLSAGGSSFRLNEGEGFFINSEVLHGYWPAESGACRVCAMVFHPRLIGGSPESIFWQRYLQPLLSNKERPYAGFAPVVSWGDAAIQALRQAWRACVEERRGYEFEVRSALSQAILQLTGSEPAPQKIPSAKALRDAERVKQMLQYIQEHYGEELTTANIAQSASVSESECLRCFRSVIGLPPIQYVKQFRVQNAAELLASTDQKIAEIGAQCGFQEMSYFAKTFRELKGCTPREYRQRSRQNPV